MLRILYIILFSFISVSIFSQNLEVHPKLTKGKLSNGLTYYIYPNKYPKGEAVYRLFLKSGSANENDNQRGLAHFLEHMAFNGTKKFPENTLVNFLESKGAKFGHDLNAHTSFNETVYKLKLPTNTEGIIDTTLTILADWIDGFQLDSLQIEEERGVILAEWLSKTGAQRDVSNQFLMEILNDSKYTKRLTIGDTGVIKNFRHEELKDYYNQWYKPELMAIAVVGDINVSKIEKLIKQKFSNIQSGNKSNVKINLIENLKDEKVKVVINKDLKKNEFNIIQLIDKSNPITTEKDYFEYLNRSIINRLFKNRFASLSFKENSFENANTSISNFINAKGIILSSAQFSSSNMIEGIHNFIGSLKQIYQYGFTKAEIEKVKKVYSKQLQRRAVDESPVSSENIMNEIYSDFYAGNAFISPQEELRLYKKYFNTIDSVSTVAFLSNLVQSSNSTYMLTTFDSTHILNEHDLRSIVRKSNKTNPVRYYSNIDIIEELMNTEPVKGKIISEIFVPSIGVTDMRLSNGVRVIFRPAETAKNRVSFSAFKMGGLYSLDSSKYIDGVFTTNVIPLSGVSKFSREEVSQYLAGNSASVRFLLEKTRSGIVGSSSLEDIETLFQLLYLRSTQAKADTSVFLLTKENSIKALQNQNKTKESQYYLDVRYLLSGRNYVTEELDTDKISKVQFQNLLPIYNKFFQNADDYTYVVMSDTTLDFIKPYITTYIASLPSVNNNRQFDYVYDGGNIKTTGGAHIANAGSSSKATVSLIFQDTKLHVDYDKFQLESEVLENILKMKLTQVVREKLGLVYGISVNTSSTLFPAYLKRSSISFTTDPNNIDTIISNIRQILNNISNSTLDFNTELTNVKKNLLKNFKINQQSDIFWSSNIRNSVANKRSFDDIMKYEDKLKNVTAHDISKLVNDNFDLDKMIKTILLPENVIEE